MGQEGAHSWSGGPDHRGHSSGPSSGAHDRQPQGFSDATARPLPAAIEAIPPTIYLNRIMALDPEKPPGYQPSTGRNLVMIGLCIAGLIFVWTYYYFATRPH